MPRVYPSQVKELIERTFPFVLTEDNSLVTLGHVAELTAIVGLAKEIPTELLTLEGANYADYAMALGAIEHMLQLWIARGDVGGLRPAKGKSPLVLLHRALAKCPDEAPAAGTTELAFIPDTQLRDSIRSDISSSNQDLINDEWKGATVLAGAASEALLLWAIQQKSNQPAVAAAVSAAVTAARMNKPRDNNPETWSLNHYIEVAAELQLIKNETAAQARIAKNFRNLIHPGRAARLGQVCDRGTAHAARAALEMVIRDIQ